MTLYAQPRASALPTSKVHRDALTATPIQRGGALLQKRVHVKSQVGLDRGSSIYFLDFRDRFCVELHRLIETSLDVQLADLINVRIESGYYLSLVTTMA